MDLKTINKLNFLGHIDKSSTRH